MSIVLDTIFNLEKLTNLAAHIASVKKHKNNTKLHIDSLCPNNYEQILESRVPLDSKLAHKVLQDVITQTIFKSKAIVYPKITSEDLYTDPKTLSQYLIVLDLSSYETLYHKAVSKNNDFAIDHLKSWASYILTNFIIAEIVIGNYAQTPNSHTLRMEIVRRNTDIDIPIQSQKISW